jgi:hypothetical protein
MDQHYGAIITWLLAASKPLTFDRSANGTLRSTATFSLRAGKGGGNNHARNNSDHYSDPVADRRAANVAI